MITSEQAKQLIKLARDSIETDFSKGDIHLPLELQDLLTEERGVFVTLTKDKKLRGCIGFPEPTHKLGVAIIKAAKAAAFQDPRFPSLAEDELNKIKIEITILTKPKKANPKKIKIGRDGLIVRKGLSSGLLLPQVFVEYKVTPKKALEMTCQKAGLPSDAWKDAEVYTFQGEILKEK